MAIRISFNSVNIDLLVGRQGLVPNLKQFRRSDRSSTGKTQTINSYGIQEVSFDAIFSEAVYYALWAWWSWARQGKEWSFTFDSDKVGNTTLDDSAASGQKVVPISSTAAFTVGDWCLVKAIDADDEFELIEIASISDGVSITAVSNLIYSYASADVFRHKDYWPNVLCADDNFNPAREGDSYSWAINFFEAL